MHSLELELELEFFSFFLSLNQNIKKSSMKSRRSRRSRKSRPPTKKETGREPKSNSVSSDHHENPLDVLSRVATLVDDCRISGDDRFRLRTMDLSQGVANPEDLRVSSQKILPPKRHEEYPLKLKLKRHGVNGLKSWSDDNEIEERKQSDDVAERFSPTVYNNQPWHQDLSLRNSSVGGAAVYSNNIQDDDVPLDMSMKSYPRENASSPVQHRPSVITSTSSNVSPNICLENIRSTAQDSGMCDPVIDEHFRRSLGKNYSYYMTKNKLAPSSDSSNNISITVDDHFAKALGDTWLTLQKGKNRDEDEITSNGSSSPSSSKYRHHHRADDAKSDLSDRTS